MSLRNAIVLSAAMLMLVSSHALAVKISTKQVNGSKVLYIDGAIDSGDGYKVDQALSRGRYSQVWLNSPGGNLKEGVNIGLALRKHGTFVRVKSGDSCVSACTVAFLGGVLRTIDRGATYKVHAYSAVRNGFRNAAEESKFLRDPKQYLTEHARSEIKSTAPYWSAALFEYFRQMILPKPKKRQVAIFNTSRHDQLSRYLGTGSGVAYDLYIKSYLPADLERVTKEGLVAGHDIVMRLEREGMQVAIANLTKAQTQQLLGERAEHAIRLLQTMFESSILSTSSLSQQTLREYGYTNVPPSN